MPNLSSLETIHGLAHEVAAALQDNPLDLALIGSMISESWMIKRTFAADVANPDVDELYQSGLASGRGAANCLVRAVGVSCSS